MHNARIMATPKPGEIRCPTCHRSTPPATFCTQCGSAIPSDARIRPRGMDRDELQDRIRARRSGGEPYRRGGAVDDEHGAYERFQPDPNDTQARRPRQADDRRRDYLAEEAPAPAPATPADERADLTRDRDEWARPAAAQMPAAAPPLAAPYAPPPSDVPVADEVDYVDNYDDDAYEPGVPYDYDDWEEPRARRTGPGAGGAVILGFLALGVLALLGGAVLAGVFGGRGTGQVDATATPSASVASIEPTASASAAPSGTPAASASAGASGEPVVFPDGFTAEAQPCLPGSASGSGCDSNGATNSGVVDIWVGFEKGTQNDVIGAEVIGPDGTSLGEGSIDLARIGCSPTCPGGWTYFPFRNLGPGTYQVLITRNGERASETTFVVS